MASRLPYAEVEPLFNLAMNLHSLPSHNAVTKALGVSESNAAHWRKTDSCPNWLPHALRGLISEKHPEGSAAPALKVGLNFTNEQLDVLNIALATATIPTPLQDTIRTIRSAVLLELAARLETPKKGK